MEWYYLQNEQTVGPFDEATLQKLISADVISSETLVFNSQLSAWVRLADCIPSPESPVSPELPKSDTQAPRSTENPSEPRFPRMALYAIPCMVMVFVTAHSTTQHHWVVVLLIFGFAIGGVEFSHLGLRDVKPGRPGHKYRHFARVILVCAYLVLILVIAILIIGFATAD